MSRLDQWLVEQGWASTRTRASELIKAGRIIRHRNGVDEVLKKPALEIHSAEGLRLVPDEEDLYVSRAGIKLAAALKSWKLSPAGLRILDVGQSTGGFTDCLLHAGAEHVIGVDVGHGQVHARIATDSRVQVFEGINAKNLSDNEALSRVLAMAPPAWIVADLSFISLTLILPAFGFLQRPGLRLIALVKPQFEVGPQGLGKGGIVRDVALHDGVERKIKLAAGENRWNVQDYIPSFLPGKDGNQEFFIHALSL